MRRGSGEQEKTRRMIEFFRRELEERGEGLHVMIARGRNPTELLLQSPRKDVASETRMSGAEADAAFMTAVQAGLIDVDFGSDGPYIQTPMAWVTHVTPEGLKMLGDWEEPAAQPTQQFTFNGPAYGIFGSQRDFRFEQVVGDLERQIEEHGGEDKEELRQMVEEIRGTLESQDSITRSKFERWSELANKHAPWLLGPLGTLFINYTFGTPGGGP
jgi:hypothetical protein